MLVYHDPLTQFSLSPGDVVLTGTPAGVGPVVEGDIITAGLADLVTISFPVVAKA